MSENALTQKRAKFAREFFEDYDAKAAAKRAGFPPASGPELMGHPAVVRELQRIYKDQFQIVEATVERVLAEYSSIAFFDPASILDEAGNVKPLRKIPEVSRRAISGIKVKAHKGGFLTSIEVKMADKNRALDSIARTLQMFNDKIEIEHTGMASAVAEIELEDRIRALQKGGRDEHMRKSLPDAKQ